MTPPRAFARTVLALFVIIVLSPIVYMLVAPFLQGLGEQSSIWSLFEERHLTLGKNSIGLAGGATLLALMVGIPLAFLLGRTDLWGRGVFLVLSITPILIPPYVHAIVWNHLTWLKESFSINIHSLGGGMLILALAYFPLVVMLVACGLRSIERNLEEASFLYYGKWHTLRRITIPLVTPHICSAGIIVFIFSIIDFGVPDILRVSVYPVEIFIQFSAFYDEKAAMTLSTPLVLITFLLVFLQKLFMGNRAYIFLSSPARASAMYGLGKLKIPALLFVLSVIIASVALPLGTLLRKAGSFSNYVKVLQTSFDQLSFSLVLALLGATATVALGFSAAYIIERSKKGVLRNLLLFASFIPLATPGITLGIGMIKVWNRPVIDFVYDSSLIVIFGYVARFISFSVVPATSGLKQLNPHVEEAALLASARWARVIRKIVIPLQSGSLSVSFFIVFIFSLGELGMTLLVIPPGKETIPIKIYNLMHYGAEQMVAALCVIIISIIFCASGLLFLLWRKLTGDVVRDNGR